MISLGDMAVASGGWIHAESRRMAVKDCVIDSRKAGRGSLFFALEGSRTDGHRFVDQVLDSGGMAVVSRGEKKPGIIMVEDVSRALVDCARWRRNGMGSIFIAITGSSGKTTTRRLLTAALESRYSVYGTSGNLNNRIGLPLVILNSPEADPDYVVLEAGMNHAGELLELGSIAQPHHCLVTNVGRAHMEFFPSLNEVALAKSELIRTTKPGGSCVIPSGSPILEETALERRLRTLRFGPGGDVWLENGVIQPWKVRPMLKLRGTHNLKNAMAAALMAAEMGIEPKEALREIGEVGPSGGRGRSIRIGSMVILDESYNANPDSTLACLEMLSEVRGRKAAVLGDMLELGSMGPDYHREVLRKADRIGLEVLILTGGIYASVAREVRSTQVFLAEDWKHALELFRDHVPDDCTVLVKGSNALKLSEMVRNLEEGE